MRVLIFWFFLSLSVIGVAGEIPQVPSSLEVAGVKLKITNAARLEIQKDVNALRASDKYFRIKLDRVNLYFPIIERVLKEEGVPDDLKYLSVQESALISDAVSVADAVGYWQFKDFTAREVGLRVDNKVDERKNIVSATRGAAKYFKRNNFLFKNWIYSVSAYQAGPGGAKRYVDKENFGSDKLTIDKDTHWYVLRFIAHVIAFRDEVGGPHSEGLKLLEYTKAENKDLDQIARQFDVDRALVKEYNKWLSHGKVPDDKVYTVIIPVTGNVKIPNDTDTSLPPLARSIKEPEPVKYPEEITTASSSKKAILIRINGIEAIMSESNDNLVKLASKTGIPTHKLEKYNDLMPGQNIIPGQIYYIKKKKNRSPIRYHVTQHGESLWDISQKYGVKLKKLAAKNRIEVTDRVKPGRVLWLRKKRSAKIPVEYHEVKKPQPRIKPPVETVITAPIMATKEPIEERTEPKADPSLVIEDEPVISYDLTSHIVKSGESIWSISMEYQMPVYETLALNNLSPEAIISPGQVLKVKAKQVQEIIETPVKATTAIHVVQAGESLWSISRHYSVTIEELLQWNNMRSNAVLSIGQSLTIGEGMANTSTSPQYVLYVVKGGDSLYRIANEHNTTVEELMQLNDLKSTSLSIGDELRVKRQ